MQVCQDGSVREIADYQTVVQPSIHKISPHSLVLRAQDKVFRFDVNQDLEGEEKVYGFYEIGEGKVIGWKIADKELVKTWEIQIPETQKVISSTSSYKGQPQCRLPVINQKQILFKNVDFSNIAILTLQKTITTTTTSSQQISQKLHLYLIHGLTGTIQFHEYQTGIKSKLPINLVYDEHNAIVSYYNVRNRVFQIWSVEAFQGTLESQLISGKYVPSFQKFAIVFRSKVYGTVLPINHIFISESKQALLKRNLLIITRENKIYSLPREFISTRRPKSADVEAITASGQSEYVTSKYPPQQYMLPTNTLAFLNYNKKLLNISQIRFSSSDLQSTIFMMGYGVDVFLLRFAPERVFDMLADGFNYLQLVVVVLGVTVAAVFFRSKAKEAKLRKMHLD